jgi:hypothetical protein
VIGGTGPEGFGLALRWAAAGISVSIGTRDPARAEAATARVHEALSGRDPQILGTDNRSAASSADVVVLAVPFGAQLSTIKQLGESLHEGQVVVDVTVPLATAVGGRPTQLLTPWEGSAAEQAAVAIPKGIQVVGAFHNISATHLADLAHAVDCDILVCGGDPVSKARVAHLVTAIPGARFVDAGPLSSARTVEALTALLIGINVRYKVPGAGIRITGLPTAPTA